MNKEIPEKISDNLEEELFKCCGSKKWVTKMYEQIPFKEKEDIHFTAENVWNLLGREDKLEAFSHHPRIGNIDKLREKYSLTGHLSEKEQSGVRDASEETLKQLSDYNKEYEKKFGYIFLVCASGKTADEMLDIIEARIKNKPEEEFENACRELIKITKLRLNNITEKLI